MLPILEEARDLGFLGPGPVDTHLRHAAGFAAALAAGGEAQATLEAAVDLGTGGGVPGLPLAGAFPDARWLLVEVGVRRAAFLRAAVATLGWDGRVAVAEVRAEELGHHSAHRGRYQAVTARGFGPPAVTAECAAPLLCVGGRAVVSDPPGGAGERWPVDGLRMLGMTRGPAVEAASAAYQLLLQASPCPDRYPRRIGVPAKRPLFSS